MITFAHRDRQVVIRSPLLGDTLDLHLRVQIKRSMSGRVRTWKVPTVLKRINLEFANLNRNKIVEIMDFINFSAGNAIIYTDYNEQQWGVKILNDPFEATHTARRNNTFSLELEVVNG